MQHRPANKAGTHSADQAVRIKIQTQGAAELEMVLSCITTHTEQCAWSPSTGAEAGGLEAGLVYMREHMRKCSKEKMLKRAEMWA